MLYGPLNRSRLDAFLLIAVQQTRVAVAFASFVVGDLPPLVIGPSKDASSASPFRQGRNGGDAPILSVSCASTPQRVVTALAAAFLPLWRAVMADDATPVPR